MANWYSLVSCDGATDYTRYRKMTGKPTCVGTGLNICAIYLNETTLVPSTDIEQKVQEYMANAVATLIAQPTGVGVKRFVYVKGPIS